MVQKVIIFGAGHRTAIFISVLKISDLVEFVADDDDRKQGLFMPGLNVPIRSSFALNEKGVGVCILSINVDSEDRLIDALKKRLNETLYFASLSPASKYKLDIFQCI